MGIQEDAAALLPLLVEQEERLQFDAFDHDLAWALGLQFFTAAREENLPISVAIRLAEQRVFHAARPGTSADQDSWLDRKHRVVTHFEQSSFRVGTSFRAQGTTFEESSGLDDALYAAHGGAFPIRVRGRGLVGTVGVSGLPQRDDHAFAVRQLGRFLAG